MSSPGQPIDAPSADSRSAGDAALRASCLRFGVLSLLTFVGLAALLAWGIGGARRGQQRACTNNQRVLAGALRAYALDCDQRLPPIECDWRRALMPILAPGADTLLGLPSRYWACPAVTSTVFYERNEALASLRLDAVPEANQGLTVLTWEGSDGVSVAYPHPAGAVYSFVDGHAACFSPDEDGKLLWSPQPAR